jgi:hypothetical protein
MMKCLIWVVGEEFALGARSVIRLENGATLITNPVAQMKWTMPFWAIGVLQVSSAFTLVWLWRRNRTSQSRGACKSLRLND